MIDYWDILSGLLLAVIGVYSVWLSRSSYFEANPFTTALSQWLRGARRARTLILVAGVLCAIFGVVGIIFAVVGKQ